MAFGGRLRPCGDGGHGLLSEGEFAQKMGDFLRTRNQFVRERSSHIQHIQKTLEDPNIKLDSVIADIIGLSGRRMIEAIIAGETDPNVLAALSRRRRTNWKRR
jgi:hypothetical protein